MKRNQTALTIIPDSAWHEELFCRVGISARCLTDMHNWILCLCRALTFSGTLISCKKSGGPEISTSSHAVEAVHQHAPHLAPFFSSLSVAARNQFSKVVFDPQNFSAGSIW